MITPISLVEMPSLMDPFGAALLICVHFIVFLFVLNFKIIGCIILLANKILKDTKGSTFWYHLNDVKVSL